MELVKQVAVADRLVLTKSDLVDTPERRDAHDELLTRLKALNPAAPVLDAAAGEATPDTLLDCGLYDPARKIPDVGRWLADEAYAATQHQHDHHHHDVNRHDARIRAFTFATDTPIPGATFEMFIDLVRSLHGPKLLAAQGHREDRRDARPAAGDPRRAACDASAGAARALARRRPAHPHRRDRARPRAGGGHAAV